MHRVIRERIIAHDLAEYVQRHFRIDSKEILRRSPNVVDAVGFSIPFSSATIEAINKNIPDLCVWSIYHRAFTTIATASVQCLDAVKYVNDSLHHQAIDWLSMQFESLLTRTHDWALPVLIENCKIDLLYTLELTRYEGDKLVVLPYAAAILRQRDEAASFIDIRNSVKTWDPVTHGFTYDFQTKSIVKSFA